MECDDVYEIMKRDISRFDTSDYTVDNVYRTWWRMKIIMWSWQNSSGLEQRCTKVKG